MRDPLRLGVNIDHVATIRNARGSPYPEPVRAARQAVEAGADGITVHLREDRRHISDTDAATLLAEIDKPLNLEMAATSEMCDFALRHRPHAICIVPEKREERTTEGGLDVAGQIAVLTSFVGELRASGIRVSLFIEPEERQLDAAVNAGAPVVELHTGAYCEAALRQDKLVFEYERQRIEKAAVMAADRNLECHAGHGLTYGTVQPVAAIPQIAELNIGHFLIGEAIFSGLKKSILDMRQLMDTARCSYEGSYT